jgi:CheY-like chemotaxis protein
MDDEEARSVAENYLEEKSLLELYDSVLIPALAMAEQDRRDNQLDDERQRFILDTTRELIEELGEEQPAQPQETDILRADGSGPSGLCVPVRDEADELAGLMLAQILRQAGHAAEAIASGFIEETLAKITQSRPDILYISALPPFAIGHARSLCRRARQNCPGIKPVLGLWRAEAAPKTVQRRLGPGCSEYIVHSLAEARLQLRLLTEQVQSSTETSAPQTDSAEQHSEAQVVEQP